MKRLIIVDVSNFIFRAFFAIRPLHSPDGTPVNAVYGVLNMFMKLFSQYRPTHILLAKDTASGSFRNEMYPQYKANRSEPPEELVPQFDLIRELIEKMKAPHFDNERYEADDIIGSACVQWKNDFDEILIASGDKDLMQFVGGHIKMLDTMKDKIYDEQGVFEKMGVRPDQIVDYLSMVGDSSDNIPGMRGIGAKGAAKLLAEHGTLEKCIEVKDSFKGKKLTTAFNEYLDDALISKELVTIVTDINLGMDSLKTEYRFYPEEELMAFLKGMGFKGVIQKLEELKRIEAQAQAGDEGESHQAIMDCEESPFGHKFIKTEEEFRAVIELVDSSSGLALHTEFDSEDIVSRNIYSISLSSDGQTSFYLNFEKSDLRRKHLDELLEKTWGNKDLEIGSGHWKRDMAYAQEVGIEVKCQSFDVVQAHYVLNAEGRHDLEVLSKDYFHYDLKPRDKKNILITELSEEEQLKFCGERSCLLYKLVNALKEELEEKNLEDIYYGMDDLLIPILSKMERQGVFINPEFFYEFEEELAKKLEALEQKIFSHNEGESLNLNSPKQVSEFLFEKLEMPIIKKTKTGISTDSEVLEKLEAKNINPVPSFMLQYRELGKLLSTYVKTLPTLVHQKTGRIHTHFNQHVAATGRLASNNPNLQNIPIRTEMGRRVRKGFIAQPGKVFLGADYSQVELRLLAHFSGDQTMLDSFRDGLDIHQQTASEVLGISLKEVTSEDRSKAKAINFGLMYGQSSFGLANQLRISRREAKEYITTYFERFSRVKTYLDSLKEEADKTGYAVTLLGRKRFLPDIHSKNRTIKAMAERMAINSPIQGTAADIIKKAMISINRCILKEGLKSRMLLQVHDELIFEVLEDELEKMKTIVKEGMENVVELDVPLIVDIGIGVNWYDLK